MGRSSSSRRDFQTSSCSSPAVPSAEGSSIGSSSLSSSAAMIASEFRRNLVPVFCLTIFPILAVLLSFSLFSVVTADSAAIPAPPYYAAGAQTNEGAVPAQPPPPVVQQPPPPAAPAAAASQERVPPPPRHAVPSNTPGYTVDKVLMPGHSWESPLNYNNGLQDWELAYASVPGNLHVVITPAVVNRRGFMFSKYPMKTANFELQFQFAVAGVDATSNTEGFAFWYVYEDAAKALPATPADEQLWNLFGYRNNFRGLGVFFSCKDRSGKINPSISAMIGDGTRTITSSTDIPTSTGVYFMLRNTSPISFKLTAGPKGVMGEMRSSPTTNWVTCFHLQGTPLAEGGFVGFTGFTGPDTMLPVEGVERPQGLTPSGDLITILNFSMYNMDLSQPGEDNNWSVKETMGHDVNVGDILRDHSHHKDQHEQTEALKQLTRMLYKHMSEQAPREQSMTRTLNSLMGLIQKVSADVREMKKEMQMVTGLNHTDVMHSMKSELSGLKNLFHRHSQHHANSLQSLTSKFDTIGSQSRNSPESTSHVKEIRELSARAQSLEKTINIQSNTTSWLALGILGVLVGFGLFVWKRFRDMEKKHYL
eukprot:GHVS01066627.1.p1 GENE.GHVS01066627.1~~GHVS01066627.1.p1  ORF type:complete len:592 (+),score=105.61 GHVS01066627.1:259-2034(+)